MMTWQYNEIRGFYGKCCKFMILRDTLIGAARLSPLKWFF